MYQAICKHKQLILGKGNLIVVSGWTPIKRIKKGLEENEYATIGQLYSPRRGIDILVRNLLANPEYNVVVAIAATREDKNAGSIQCLMDFFKYGFKKDNSSNRWRINSEIEGYIGGDIPEDILDELRHTVVINSYLNYEIAMEKIPEFNEVAKSIRTHRLKSEFPPPKQQNKDILPGEFYGHRIQAKTIAECWVKILQRIRTNGIPRPTGYDGTWQELINLMAIVTDEPKDFYFPNPNYLPCTPESIIDYLPQVLENAPYEAGVKYTYGQRIYSWFGKNQFKQVLDKLVEEIDSASGVICLWDSGSGSHNALKNPRIADHNKIKRYNRDWGDSDHDHSGSPCLNHIWFRVVQGEVSMTALFRSNDMFAAWPYNAMALRTLQAKMFDALSEYYPFLFLGPLITISQSAHIYDDCNDAADRIIKQHYLDIIRRDRLHYNDACGNFIIRWKDHIIYADQTTPQGDFVRNYSHRNPLALSREIISANPSISSDHASYISYEITKASLLQDVYIQDE